MSRKSQAQIKLSPECQAATDRVFALANRMAPLLVGEAPGDATAPRAAALSMAMVYFLLRIDPDDLHAMFFAESSLADAAFRPFSPGELEVPPLAWLI